MAVEMMGPPGPAPVTSAGSDDLSSELRLVRLGGGAALLGQMLLLASSALHPAGEHPADHVRVFAEYARDGSWTTVHLVQWVGGVLMFCALALLARHVVRTATRGALLARVAMGASVTVAAIFTVLQAVDGVALKMAVDAWAQSHPEQQAPAFSAAEAIRWTEIGLNAIARILQGVAIGTLAVSAAAAGFHGRILGAVGAMGGIGGIAGGIATAYTGFSTTVAIIAMPPWFLTTAWLIGTGIVMWRRGDGSPSEHKEGRDGRGH